MTETTSTAASAGRAVIAKGADLWSGLDRGWRATLFGLLIVGVHVLYALL